MRPLRRWGTMALAAFCALLAVACSDALPAAPQAVSDSSPSVRQSVDPAPSERVLRGARGASEFCAGLPTQVVVVTPESFEVDERLVRVLIAPSGACSTTVTLRPENGAALGGNCALIQPAHSIVGALRGELSLGADLHGECDWVGKHDIATLGSMGPSASLAPGCHGIDSLSLVVNAESFNQRGRVDAVAFVPETRCYVFLSAAQEPGRAEPFQFKPSQECVLRHSRTPQGDCGQITFWSGRGRGGVGTLAEAEAAVALIHAR